MRHVAHFTFFLLTIFISGCAMKQNADMIFFNGKIYTVDSSFTIAESFAITNGKILAVGSNEKISSRFDSKKRIDLKGKSVYPGFYDAHCHFFGYGSDLVKCDLYGTKSFEEVIQKIREYSSGFQSSETELYDSAISHEEATPAMVVPDEAVRQGWLLGRGWDQNDWVKKEYPDNKKLDSLFPHTPVFLVRVDGHAALCNSEALRRASISTLTKVSGGIVEVKNGKLTGILIDNAMELVKEIIPSFDEALNRDALLSAQKRCFSVGLTSVCDAGLGKDTIELIQELQSSGKLKIRINAMIADGENNLEYYFKVGKTKTERLNICSVKMYSDGALGSRGACLLEDYSDKKGHKGFLLHDTAYFRKIAEECFKNKLQLCTHCIGDSAVRTVLKIYGEVLKGKNDLRWRIEHCQVVHPDDISMFEKFSIIPSVQPTHATSDMYWAEERLGKNRIRSAYAYNDLLRVNKMIAFGTDFPVENINPLYTFYAAVARKDLKNFPSYGFHPENKISREDAMRAMTTWAAFACFEEKEKGMIAAGMFADFVILTEDVMVIAEEKIPSVKVEATYLNGEKVFTNEILKRVH